MKSFLPLALFVLLLNLSAATSHASTITGMSLETSYGSDAWGGYNPIVDTYKDVHNGRNAWVLGVTNAPGGPLINGPDTEIGGSNLTGGTHWLYSVISLRPYVRLMVDFSDGETLSTVFAIRGVKDSGTPWLRLSGSDKLSLGWALESAALVGTNNDMTPGYENTSLMTDIMTTPEPSTCLLLAAGLSAGGLLRLKNRKRL